MYNFCLCICVVLRFFVQQRSQVRVKEVSQDVLDLSRLGAPCSRGQHRIQSRLQDLCGAESSRAGLCGVEPFNGAGEPDEPLQTLDVSATVVHQLVFGHGPAAAGDQTEVRALPRNRSPENKTVCPKTSWDLLLFFFKLNKKNNNNHNESINRCVKVK